MSTYAHFKNWVKNNPQKRKAQQFVFCALRNGTLQKQPCAVCGYEKVEAHHEDYSKPLEVIWLCKKDHIEADKARRLREKISTG